MVFFLCVFVFLLHNPSPLRTLHCICRFRDAEIKLGSILITFSSKLGVGCISLMELFHEEPQLVQTPLTYRGVRMVCVILSALYSLTLFTVYFCLFVSLLSCPSCLVCWKLFPPVSRLHYDILTLFWFRASCTFLLT